jgi:adenosine deaminase
VPDLRSHPVADFLRRGLTVHLATDDPAVFGCDLTGEYERTATAFRLTEAEARQLLFNAVDAAWCNEDIKSWLRKEIDGFFSAAGAGPSPA